MANNQDDAISHVHFFSSEPTISACPPLKYAGPPISQFFQWNSSGEQQRYKDSDCVVDADGRLWVMLHGEWVAASGICDDK